MFNRKKVTNRAMSATNYSYSMGMTPWMYKNTRFRAKPGLFGQRIMAQIKYIHEQNNTCIKIKEGLTVFAASTTDGLTGRSKSRRSSRASNRQTVLPSTFSLPSMTSVPTSHRTTFASRRRTRCRFRRFRRPRPAADAEA